MSEPEPPSTARGPASDVLVARGVKKSFLVGGDRRLDVLHGVDLTLRRGEALSLMGPSGAGKSTLLHILGLLDRPSAGEVEIEGSSAWSLPAAERARLRNRRIGFVFQFYHLLPELSALENVVLPSMIAHSRASFSRQRRELYDRSRELLVSFGLEQRLTHRPAQLSGGERQRVALARALFHDPPIVIADEPTGNLDSATGERVLELMFGEHARRRFSLLLVTHDERLAQRCDRELHMEDGRIDAASPDPALRG